MSRCGFGGGVTGTAVGRCCDEAIRNSLFCGPHRVLSLGRVPPMSAEVALRLSLRWETPKRFKVRQVLS